MKVYYSGEFGQGQKFEKPGKEIRVKKAFMWGGQQWYIPAIYSCSKGLVIDFCVAIPRERVEIYYKNWNLEKRISELSNEELEKLENENPFTRNIEVVARVNGKELKFSRMCLVGWHPCEAEREQIEDEQEELMEYYNCDRNQGWSFIRACFSWSTTRKPKMKTIFLTLKEHPAAYFGVHFTTKVPCDRHEIMCIHPVCEQTHKITIYECEKTSLSERLIQFNKDMQFPNYFNKLTYGISPELPQEEFQIQDCARSDKPKSLESNSSTSNVAASCCVVIGGADGTFAIHAPTKDSEENLKRLACSSLHFTQVPEVEWRTIFYVKENEDYETEINI
jgi:hypothetical protein